MNASSCPSGSRTVSSPSASQLGRRLRVRPGVRESALERFERGRVAELEVDLTQARCAVGGARSAATLPRVQADVVVVAAGGEERRRGQLRLFFEAERVAVEGAGAGHVGDLQVHVADERLGGHRGGRLVERLREQVLQVERQRDHVHAVPVAGALPALARPVGVELDPEAVGVAQVERLGDAVVGGALERPRRVATRRTLSASAARLGCSQATW